jgi:Tfp pilus assembly protein PilF
MALLFFDCFTTRHQVPKRSQESAQRFQGHLHLAATYMMAGNEAKARESAAEELRIDSNFSLERFAKTTPWKNQDDLTNGLIEPLRKAGLK